MRSEDRSEDDASMEIAKKKKIRRLSEEGASVLRFKGKKGKEIESKPSKL